MRESFQLFWTLTDRNSAKRFMDSWIKMVKKTQIKPMKKVADMLQRHQGLILNWFDIYPRISNGVVEGFNNKAKLIMRRAYGFGSFSSLEIAFYHNLGKLPEPPSTHSFFWRDKKRNKKNQDAPHVLFQNVLGALHWCDILPQDSGTLWHCCASEHHLVCLLRLWPAVVRRNAYLAPTHFHEIEGRPW